MTVSAGITFFSRPMAISVYRVLSWASSSINTLRRIEQGRTLAAKNHMIQVKKNIKISDKNSTAVGKNKSINVSRLNSCTCIFSKVDLPSSLVSACHLLETESQRHNLNTEPNI